MKNARLRQTRQSDSRERSAFHHDLTGDADGLVVSGSQGRAQHERWQSHHASADFAQTRIGGGDEGNSGSSANELRPDGEGALRDRKSTRLNSSHTVISYAVFCLKKKNITRAGLR